MRIQPTEDELQTQIVDWLLLSGFIVLVTTVRRAGPNEETGKWNYGTSKGIPDLLVSRKTWPRCVWLGIEVKRPGHPIRASLEQRELEQAGRICFVRSLEEVQSEIDVFENGAVIG